MICRRWALVCLLPNCRRQVVDSFTNRSDAEDRLRFLNRSTPEYEGDKTRGRGDTETRRQGGRGVRSLW